MNEPPYSWIIVEPDPTLSRNLELVVAKETTIVVVDSLDHVNMVRGPLLVGSAKKLKKLKTRI